MFGYIRPSKPRLSEQDEARFQSVYCGLCHELGRKYGFSARFVLNFDFTFLAILLSGAQEPECESCLRFRAAALSLKRNAKRRENEKMDFLELAKERYSVRKFSDKKVEREKLDAILEAGAPL